MEQKKQGLTGRGILWELLNSLWMILSIFPILNAVPFLYIGFSARQHKWVFLGCLFILFGAFWAPPEFMGFADPDLWLALAFITWILGIVLCFVFRKEYLIRRDLLLKTGGNKSREKALKEKLTREYAADALRSAEQTKAAQAPRMSQPVARPAQGVVFEARVDVNTCTEEELASLPGITAVQARKAVTFRTGNGGFSDLDDFLQYLAVKPHFAVQIRELASCSAPVQKDQDRGRMLDL